MPRTLSRSFYVQPDATPRPDPESGAVVYLYTDRAGRPCAQAFAGRAAKPVWRHSFVDETARDRHVDAFFARQRASKRAAAERRSARRRPHDLRVGDVLVSTWGYEQTNVSWYEITRVLPRSVEARPVASLRTETGPLHGTCVPVRGRYTGPARRYRASAGHPVRVSKSAVAVPWDGRPRHWTAYA